MVNGVIGGGSLDFSARQRELLQTSEISVFTLGGDANNALALIRSGNLSDFFEDDVAITTFVPISYTLRNLGDNSIATVSETTAYELRECVASTAGEVPQDGLIVELKMNGAERTSGNPGGTLNSAPDAASQGVIYDGCRVANAADRFGFADRAFDFFGRGGCDAADPSLIYLDAPGYTRSFTFATWMTNDFSNRWIVGPRNGPALEIDSSTRLVFTMPGRAPLVDPTPVSSTEWAFVAVTASYSGSTTTVKLYRNAQKIAETSFSGDLGIASSAPTLIGNGSGGPDVAYPGRNRDFQGKLDDLRIYDRALSAEEVTILYAEAP
jgi:hypothetical protein